jgi:Primase X
MENEVIQGLEFLLSQLINETKWPRTVATKLTDNAQIIVYSKEEALKMYKDSNYIDCRISAYPYNKDTKVQIIDFVLIDLDLSSFSGSRQLLDKWLVKISKHIKEIFGSDFKLTIIWSGRGYHIYLHFKPLEYILEESQEFITYSREPSIEFLRFIERYLSLGKCDSSHNSSVAFSNCMLRVPGSLNSKCNATSPFAKVAIKQIGGNLNQKTLSLEPLIGDFLAFLVDKREDSIQKATKPSSILSKKNSDSLLPIIWIELLLQTQLRDFRKYCIWRILTPYLINKRGFDEDKSHSIIEEWLNKCIQLQPLDFDANRKIIDGIKGAIKTGYYPIAFKNLKEEQPELYKIIWNLITCKTKAE